MTTDALKKVSWLVSVGLDRALHCKLNTSGALAATTESWNAMGGSVRYEPFVVHCWDNLVYILYIDPGSGNLIAKFSGNSSPSPIGKDMYNLGGFCVGAPVAILYNPTCVAVYLVGGDGCMYQCLCQKSGSWTWTKLPLSDRRTPAFQPDKIAASTNGDNRIDLVAVGVDNQLYHRYWVDGQANWSSWVGVGCHSVGSRPTCTTSSKIRCDIVIRDAADHYLYHTAFDNNQYLGWQKASLDRAIFDPAMTIWSNDRLEMVYVTPNGGVTHTWVTGISAAGKLGTWSDGSNPIDKFGGQTNYSPKISVREGSQCDVYTTGMDGAIYSKVYTPSGGWTGWNKLGGSVVTKPC